MTLSQNKFDIMHLSLLLICVTAVSAESYSKGYRATTPGRRALQAVAESICGTNAAVSTSPGTFYDDQPNIDNNPVDCTTGVCDGPDSSCFGGVCTGHANGYSDNLDCGKQLVAPVGDTILLTFSQMALEQHPACQDPGCDYVTIYDGPDSNAPVLGQWSGTSIPAPVETSSNYAFVRFQTDVGNYGLHVNNVDDDPGFFLDWSFEQNINAGTGVTQADGSYGICPADVVLTTPHGTIHDDENAGIDCTQPNAACGSNDNQGYQDNLNCYTTIHAPTGSTVQLTFTQLNLEGPGHVVGCEPCTDPRGCDWIEIWDGPDSDPAHSTLINTYSGDYINVQTGSTLPSVHSTGQDMHIVFRTDTHNCGITSSEDPGFFADWVFIENGQNICQPDAAVLTDPRGTLHDDDPAGAIHCETAYDCGLAGGDNGYHDNLDCGVRLHAPRGATVNLHFTQMNLEGGDNGLCGHDVGDNSQIDCTVGCSTNGGCGDYVEIYDGRDASAPLIAHVTGAVADARGAQDSFTSSGRNMFVRFVTDTGNYGLTGTTEDPGFWLEWQFIEDGQECMDYNVLQNMGIVGHNNENFECSSEISASCVEQCEDACCQRDWCKSFDMGTGANSCALADVDATVQQAATVAWAGGDLHERVHLAPTPPPLGDEGCANMMHSMTSEINAVCCGSHGCADGELMTECSEECDSIWSPFALKCSEWLRSADVLGADGFDQVTTLCENEEYGLYRPGNNHGRCSDGDINQWLDELSPACCGENMEHCAFCDGASMGLPAGTLATGSVQCTNLENGAFSQAPTVDGTESGQPFCAVECAPMIEQMYAECHPRFAEMGIQDGMEDFLATCQGVGGHRRSLATATSDEMPQPADSEEGDLKHNTKFRPAFASDLYGVPQQKNFNFP